MKYPGFMISAWEAKELLQNTVFPFHLLCETHVPVSLGFRAVQWLSLHVLEGCSVGESQVWDLL